MEREVIKRDFLNQVLFKCPLVFYVYNGKSSQILVIPVTLYFVPRSEIDIKKIVTITVLLQRKYKYYDCFFSQVMHIS